VQFSLPVTKQVVQIRDYMPHGVVSKVQEAMFQGVNIASDVLTPSKEQLHAEFPERMAEINGLPEKEYQKALQAVRSEYAQRKMKFEGLSLKNAEEANVRRIEGMVTQPEDKLREWANNLPEKDFQTILQKIEAVENGEDAKKG
jgi:hypothetical protein